MNKRNVFDFSLLSANYCCFYVASFSKLEELNINLFNEKSKIFKRHLNKINANLYMQNILWL